MAVIAGNWKMNVTASEAYAFFESLSLDGVPDEHELVLFPPALSVPAVVSTTHGEARIQVGVQNIHWEESGAFTGEISAAMAADVGADFVLIGHSERRHVFGETDEEVARKTEAALSHGLTPVICVGEKLDERRAGRVDEVITRQLEAVLPVLSSTDARALVAYEPVWAIGTGETATPADASEAHTTLRKRLVDALGPKRADAIPLLYGGSVKPDNADALLAASEVDGVLVGGASLDADSFARIARAGA